PVGDYVFLEPNFYGALHRLTDPPSSSFSPWLIERARYELPAKPSLLGNVAAVNELRASFDIHTFQPEIKVQLPLRREQVLLLEGRAGLDGKPATLGGRLDGTALIVNVDSVGQPRLELALGAAARQTTDATILELEVPPAATAAAVLPEAGAASGEVVS